MRVIDIKTTAQRTAAHQASRGTLGLSPDIFRRLGPYAQHTSYCICIRRVDSLASSRASMGLSGCVGESDGSSEATWLILERHLDSDTSVKCFS